ncbi:MAG: 4-alpha-glucanotransferase [Lachnospiraceae bacterium]|nr:4-alpha-glucanotransferase [Lachnospiraceae bacterium]
MRAGGILLAISSLPSLYGIGSFSKSAYEFVDQLKRAGQKYWQILPLGPTGYGDSPYQSFSAFAGNPYFIDLDTLAEEGLLQKEEYENCDFGEKAELVDYEKLYLNRFPLLRLAYQRSHYKEEAAYAEFCEENDFWLEDYCLYMAVKNHFEGNSWTRWEEPVRMREAGALEYFRAGSQDEIGFYQFLQYKFYEQWKRVKAYANAEGIEIIGDIPIYVSLDSADSWTHPELFQFDERHMPSHVAGCPPDAFSADGQLWGNPLYDWEYHEKTDYAWWKQRLAHCLKLYDVVRVDHFRGFDEYYSIPYGAVTAAAGSWQPGPGIGLFHSLRKSLGDVPIIAEDLGYVTKSVEKLVRDSGYPGMKVMEFAFDSREAGNYMPYHYDKNCVVYTGTHDNQTLQGWYEELSESDRRFAREYLELKPEDRKNLHWSFIRLTLGCVADTAIIAMQDYLGLGAWARMNHPSTLGSNWRWRLTPGQLTEPLLQQIRHLTEVYGRGVK